MQINKDTINNLLNPIAVRWRVHQALKKTQPPKRSKIDAFAGEREILRQPTMLITDTRLVFIDPYDRKLKTYMFEHMISVNKDYYKPTNFIRGFCKGLIFIGVLLVLITLIIDLLDNNSRGFVLVYIPALLSLIVGLLVWRDMRPKYKVEWKMRDGSTDKIATELLFGGWLMNNQKRESGMDELTRAMNEALSGKAWWPANNGLHARGDNPYTITNLSGIDQRDQPNTTSPDVANDTSQSGRRHLKLVTENYE